MILTWLFYSTLIGALAGVSAIALERVARMWRVAGRWPWLAAIAVTLAVPPLVGVIQRNAAAPMPAINIERGARPAPAAPSRAAITPPVELRLLDRPLAIAWPLASLIVLAVFARALVMVARARRRWRTADVDGTTVLVADETGPAVVGVVRPRVVVPEWALGIDAAQRELLLLHELEHVRARDPLAVVAAGAALVLVPWNVALWWQVRRLRLAIELDCDQRVLDAARNGHPRADVRTYASLLITVGQALTVRRPSHTAWAPALSEAPSSLERRIVAMTARSSTHRVARAAALVAGAAAVIVAACEAPRPDPVGPQQGRVAQANTNLDTQIRALVAQHFPEIARGDTSSRPMMFLLASDRHVLGTARGPSVANAHFKTPSSDASVTMPESAHIDSAHVKTHLEMARTSHPDMVEEHSLMSKIDPNWIESVDVRKYKAGEIGPNAAAAIVIVLKPGAPDPTR